MRLKEIKPGMVIHCKTKEEMVELSKHIELTVSVEYIWNYGNDGIRRDCIFIKHDGIYGGFDTYIYFSSLCEKITEFSDLILPELTAEEALQIASEICKNTSHCVDCPIRGNCYRDCDSDKGNVVEVLCKWKSDHEKKEPEIETVDICRIIEIKPDGRKRCVHEEDLASGSTDAEIKIMVEAELKRYCMEHDGEFIAVHEVVSRVKK